jgi:hypothetical protein
VLHERGAPRLPDQSWAEELAEHTKTLRRRRDLAFRLGRLAALHLRRGDAETVSSLREYNVRHEDKRMKALTEGQEKLVRALEARYCDERAEAAEVLAGRLAKLR